MQVYEDRRSEKIFERYGFKFIDRKEVTKFKDYYHERVWVATIYNEFEKKDDPPLPTVK